MSGHVQMDRIRSASPTFWENRYMPIPKRFLTHPRKVQIPVGRILLKGEQQERV